MYNIRMSAGPVTFSWHTLLYGIHLSNYIQVQ